MKNRTIDRRSWSKWFSDKWVKFQCNHEFELVEKVGPAWDIRRGVKLKHKCSKCGMIRRIPNYRVDEVPDNMVDNQIIYR